MAVFDCDSKDSAVNEQIPVGDPTQHPFYEAQFGVVRRNRGHMFRSPFTPTKLKEDVNDE